MKKSQEVIVFIDAYNLWQSRGAPEMISVKSGHGPFSRKLGLRSNYRLFYLYNPKYTEFALEIEE